MPVRATTDWKGPEFTALAVRSGQAGLKDAAFVLEGGMKTTLTNKSPSKPGDPPGIVTGLLRASITSVFAGLSARVGTNRKYGRWLEYGTSKMAARPWVLRAFVRNKAQIQRTFVDTATREYVKGAASLGGGRGGRR